MAKAETGEGNKQKNSNFYEAEMFIKYNRATLDNISFIKMQAKLWNNFESCFWNCLQNKLFNQTLQSISCHRLAPKILPAIQITSHKLTPLPQTPHSTQHHHRYHITKSVLAKSKWNWPNCIPLEGLQRDVNHCWSQESRTKAD